MISQPFCLTPLCRHVRSCPQKFICGDDFWLMNFWRFFCNVVLSPFFWVQPMRCAMTSVWGDEKKAKKTLVCACHSNIYRHFFGKNGNICKCAKDQDNFVEKLLPILWPISRFSSNSSRFCDNFQVLDPPQHFLWHMNLKTVNLPRKRVCNVSKGGTWIENVHLDHFSYNCLTLNFFLCCLLCSSRCIITIGQKSLILYCG